MRKILVFIIVFTIYISVFPARIFAAGYDVETFTDLDETGNKSVKM